MRNIRIEKVTLNIGAGKEQAKLEKGMKLLKNITGVPAESIEKAARLFADNSPAAILYAMGITQHTHGTDHVLAFANLAMLTGNIGKPSTGVNPFCGQNNFQGAVDRGG